MFIIIKICKSNYFFWAKLPHSINISLIAHLSRLIAVMTAAHATWLQLSREVMMVQRVLPNTQCPPRAHWWIRNGMTVTWTRSATAKFPTYTSGTVFLADLQERQERTHCDLWSLDEILLKKQQLCENNNGKLQAAINRVM